MTENAPAGADAVRCPVCRARLRGDRNCGRCGADVTDFLRTLVTAWRERRDGWRRLHDGDYLGALAAAERSSALAASPAARQLTWLCRVLLAGRS